MTRAVRQCFSRTPGFVKVALRMIWLGVHLFMPAFYCNSYRARPSLPIHWPSSAYRQVSYLREEWTFKTANLERRWDMFKDILTIILSTVVPYLAVTKAPGHSLVFSLGQLCLVTSFVGILVMRSSISSITHLRGTGGTDAWLEASRDGKGLFFWTMLSLPAVWFSMSVGVYVAAILSAFREKLVVTPIAVNEVTKLWILLGLSGFAMVHAIVIGTIRMKL